MAIEINIPEGGFENVKLFVGAPMYGGMCAGMFTRSLVDLSATCLRHGIEVKFYFLFNESLITRARNYICDEFVRSDCDHLMFIDSDIGFNPMDVVALLAMQMSDEKYDIIGGPYPKKTISWEKVKMAVDKGFADDDPNNLDRYIGDFVFNPKQNSGSIPLHEPSEVLEIGTGFMMIHRRVFEKFSEKFGHYSYKPDHIRTEHFDGSREIMQYFQAEIDAPSSLQYMERLMSATEDQRDEILQEYQEKLAKSSKRYLSEDYWFCQKVQQLGLRTWLCPWMKLAHVGTYVFGGSLPDLAALGASATADAGQLNAIKAKNKK